MRRGHPGWRTFPPRRAVSGWGGRTLDLERFLEPVSEAAPCGPDLQHATDFEQLRRLAAEETRPDWARQRDRALALAGEGRDLRAWVWLARSELAAQGLPGLAASLELIARGLETFWDTLPPFDPDEQDPRERYMARLMALSELGCTSYLLNRTALDSRRDIFFLAQDVDRAVGSAGEGEAVRALIARCRAAMDAICGTFLDRYGAAADPQLGFELLRERLAALEARLDANGGDHPERTGGETGPKPILAQGVPGSRDEVVRLLDQVLDYYRINEPASPVPLLVQRAKRLVPMSFMEAMRELAPGGLKELQAVAGGGTEEARQQK